MSISDDSISLNSNFSVW